MMHLLQVLTVFLALEVYSPRCKASISDNFFKIKYMRAFAQDLGAVKTVNVTSQLACVVACSDYQDCEAFYLQANPPPAPSLSQHATFLCHILPDRMPNNQAIPGNGTYGYNNSPSSSDIPVPAPFTLTHTDHGLAALFDCNTVNSGMSNVAILYDYVNDAWPSVSTGCANSLCNQRGLSASILRIEQTGGTYTFNTLCPQGEQWIGNAACNAFGSWSYESNHEAGCLSTTCYRNTRTGRAIYIGHVNQSVNGITCQRWDSQSPNWHLMFNSRFWLDGFDRSNAQNYCRDPDPEGTPWCYQSSGSRWAYCTVPRCQI